MVVGKKLSEMSLEEMEVCLDHPITCGMSPETEEGRQKYALLEHAVGKRTKFCGLLVEAIADEEKAVKDYAKLKNGGVFEDTIFEGIAKDEAKHAEQLKVIGRMLCRA